MTQVTTSDRREVRRAEVRPARRQPLALLLAILAESRDRLAEDNEAQREIEDHVRGRCMA